MTESSGDTAMAEEGTRSRLGRGLAALIGDVGDESPVDRPRGQRRLPTGSLRPNARNPRREFPNAELDELAASLRERGIIQPIVVRRRAASPTATRSSPASAAGARRSAPGCTRFPSSSSKRPTREALQLAIIENVQRADLNPLEEAEGYRALMDEFGNSQEDIARIVGKSRSYVANTLRLLKLSDAVKAYIHSGKLTAGHARMLVGEPNADALAEEIVARELNVRQVEAMARARAQKSGKIASGRKARGSTVKTADMLAFEKRVSDATGLVVSIDHHDDHGTLTIRYRSLEQLDDLVQRLVRGQ